jgi:hypothetical protein
MYRAEFQTRCGTKQVKGGGWVLVLVLVLE